MFNLFFLWKFFIKVSKILPLLQVSDLFFEPSAALELIGEVTTGQKRGRIPLDFGQKDPAA